METVTTTPQLDRLVEDLERAFANGCRRDEIATLLRRYAADHEDWRAFATHSDEHYTRNQVARNEHFELLLLCWAADQESPIHNHEGQHCWMAILEGHVEELRYCCPGEVRPGPLEPLDAATFAKGEVAFIQDEIGLHVVRSAKGAPGVSLHLYADPYDACNVYCPETGTLTRKTLRNDTVRGVPVPVA